MELREADNRADELIRELTKVWEASVRATHDFLSEADIVRLRGFVPSALATVPYLVVVTDAEGKAVAFMGIDGAKIEMLFIAPAARGHGLGRQLVEYGRAAFGVTAVDVNEQNPQAHGFYEHLGFRVVGRSERDGQGAPYPILHMRMDRFHAEPNETHAEPQSSQSYSAVGKSDSVPPPTPSISAASASLREQTVRTGGVDRCRAEPQSCRNAGKPVPVVPTPSPTPSFTSSPFAPLRDPISPNTENI